MRRLLCTSAILAAGLAWTAPALAQPAGDPGTPVTPSQPAPDTLRASPGIAGPEAVNPAPGAHGPYVGAGRQNFYDVDQRIAMVSEQVQSLPVHQRRRASSELRSIKSEEATQRARHGDLRDWDRENLNARLDKLAQTFPTLSASTAGQPPPGQ